MIFCFIEHDPNKSNPPTFYTQLTHFFPLDPEEQDLETSLFNVEESYNNCTDQNF